MSASAIAPAAMPFSDPNMSGGEVEFGPLATTYANSAPVNPACGFDAIQSTYGPPPPTFSVPASGSNGVPASYGVAASRAAPGYPAFSSPGRSPSSGLRNLQSDQASYSALTATNLGMNVGSYVSAPSSHATVAPYKASQALSRFQSSTSSLSLTLPNSYRMNAQASATAQSPYTAATSPAVGLHTPARGSTGFSPVRAYSGASQRSSFPRIGSSYNALASYSSAAAAAVPSPAYSPRRPAYPTNLQKTRSMVLYPQPGAGSCPTGVASAVISNPSSFPLPVVPEEPRPSTNEPSTSATATKTSRTKPKKERSNTTCC